FAPLASARGCREWGPISSGTRRRQGCCGAARRLRRSDRCFATATGARPRVTRRSTAPRYDGSRGHARRRCGMTPLRRALEDYLRIRRRLGFELKAVERHLNDFVDFLERAGAQQLTIALAVMWARLPVDAHPHWCKRRLGFVRGFARYLATIDPSTE